MSTISRPAPWRIAAAGTEPELAEHEAAVAALREHGRSAPEMPDGIAERRDGQLRAVDGHTAEFDEHARARRAFDLEHRRLEQEERRAVERLATATRQNVTPQIAAQAALDAHERIADALATIDDARAVLFEATRVAGSPGRTRVGMLDPLSDPLGRLRFVLRDYDDLALAYVAGGGDAEHLRPAPARDSAVPRQHPAPQAKTTSYGAEAIERLKKERAARPEVTA